MPTLVGFFDTHKRDAWSEDVDVTRWRVRPVFWRSLPARSKTGGKVGHHPRTFTRPLNPVSVMFEPLRVPVGCREPSQRAFRHSSVSVPCRFRLSNSTPISEQSQEFSSVQRGPHLTVVCAQSSAGLLLTVRWRSSQSARAQVVLHEPVSALSRWAPESSKVEALEMLSCVSRLDLQARGYTFIPRQECSGHTAKF